MTPPGNNSHHGSNGATPAADEYALDADRLRAELEEARRTPLP